MGEIGNAFVTVLVYGAVSEMLYTYPGQALL